MIVIFLALPRSVSLTPSSSMPRSLKIGVAAGEHGDVAQHRLAAIAVAGGLHRTDLQDAAELVDDERRQGFAFDIFGDDQQRLVGLAESLRGAAPGSWRTRSFLRRPGSGSFRARPSCSSWIGDEVRREEAAIELHAFDDFDRRFAACLPSSTVITPSLPTFMKASASTLPIEGSLLPAIVAICCSLFLVLLVDRRRPAC